jgi:hypothetical protein
MERSVKFQSRIVANWDRQNIVEGRVLEFDKMLLDNKERPYMTVLTKDGEVQVFESEGLKDAFASASVGDFVRFEFLALVETKAKRAFRQFRAQVWDGKADGPVPKPTATKVPRAARKAR